MNGIRGRSVEINGDSAEIDDGSMEINDGSAEINYRSAGRIQQRQQHNELAWKHCRSQLGSATFHFSAPKPGNVLVKGVPSSCMALVTVITGKYKEGNPIPMGSDSVLFQNLSNKEIREIQRALDARR
ncbi:hypothetical protein DL766_001039 [Monosporascus sp. MC13-8B]|uniref:Uncharacterized protein n=1 Tax=Monosporascus cannonballus TaxID=155416 RepID=A0ABY0H6T4_9PEZI|nr:hypothetical protein DL762_004798 [Monosporascus cannonballus]RYP00845.1 hypothetical protein DL763_000570 [Monosporascus cannonballus]RYP38330.1 hypothetical protein DL766_001039 [Monosporascus sp. MC13-8B]